MGSDQERATRTRVRERRWLPPAELRSSRRPRHGGGSDHGGVQQRNGKLGARIGIRQHQLGSRRLGALLTTDRLIRRRFRPRDGCDRGLGSMMVRRRVLAVPVIRRLVRVDVSVPLAACRIGASATCSRHQPDSHEEDGDQGTNAHSRFSDSSRKVSASSRDAHRQPPCEP